MNNAHQSGSRFGLLTHSYHSPCRPPWKGMASFERLPHKHVLTSTLLDSCSGPSADECISLSRQSSVLQPHLPWSLGHSAGLPNSGYLCGSAWVPSSSPRTWNSFQAITWGNCSIYLIYFPFFPEIIVLCLLLSSVFKIVVSDILLLWVVSRSKARSRSPWSSSLKPFFVQFVYFYKKVFL